MSTPAANTTNSTSATKPENSTQKNRYLKKKQKQKERSAAQDAEAKLAKEASNKRPITFAQVLKAPKPAPPPVQPPKQDVQPANTSTDARDAPRVAAASALATATVVSPSMKKAAAPPPAPKKFKKKKSKTTRTLAEMLGLPATATAADDEAAVPIAALNVPAPAKKTLISYSKEAEKKTAANPVEVPKRGKVANPNIMDSTTEVIVRRGKEREKPKAKRPSKLKRAILAERTRRYVEYQQAKLVAKAKKEGESGDAAEKAEEEAEAPLENPESDLEGLGLSSDDEDTAEEKEKDKEKAEKEPTTPAAPTLTAPTAPVAKAESAAPLPPPAKATATAAVTAVPLPAKIPRIPNANPVREYCDQELSADLDAVVQTLLSELKRFQDRAFHKDPVKAKKRFVCGLKEVLRGVTAKKIKAVIMVPNLEECSVAGGLDELREELMTACKRARVPVVYALSRAKLGRALGKSVRISVVGVYLFEGAQDHFTKMVDMSRQLRAAAKKKSAPSPAATAPSHLSTVTVTAAAAPKPAAITTEALTPNATLPETASAHSVIAPQGGPAVAAPSSSLPATAPVSRPKFDPKAPVFIPRNMQS